MEYVAENIEIVDKGKRFDTLKNETAQPVRVKGTKSSEFRRMSTKMTEFDRLLGGGIVSGSRHSLAAILALGNPH